ncbi:hypothetical protein [Dyella humicola]|uniref:hypothetical protein n=1 Tax=Dyella humicola TaxID=2992126 RepID=UPI00224EB62F|nr:hypothetical protein [Dyella humicola]
MSIFGKDQRQSLESTPLFTKEGTPQFIVYVACRSEDESCSTVHKIFSEWTGERRIRLHLVDEDDAVFTGRPRSSDKAIDKPYRLALQIKPLVVPSFSQFRGGMYATGNYDRPRVGYRADVYVVDAATSTVIQKLPIHQEVTTNPDDKANPYIEAEMVRLIASLDPTYPFPKSK